MQAHTTRRKSVALFPGAEPFGFTLWGRAKSVRPLHPSCGTGLRRPKKGRQHHRLGRRLAVDQLASRLQTVAASIVYGCSLHCRGGPSVVTGRLQAGYMLAFLWAEGQGPSVDAVAPPALGRRSACGADCRTGAATVWSPRWLEGPKAAVPGALDAPSGSMADGSAEPKRPEPAAALLCCAA